jgi:hypothetical protein
MGGRTVWTAVVLLSLGAVAAATPAVWGHGAATEDDQRLALAPEAPERGADDVAGVTGGTLVTGSDTSVGHEADGGSRSGDRRALNVTYTYRRLPEERGLVGVRMRIAATGAVDRARIEFPEESTVVGTDGVTRNGTGYVWTGDRPATVRYRLRIDWSYVGNVRDSWTLLQHLPPTIRAEPTAETNGTIALAGEGYVGNRTLVLGAHEVYRRQVDGETVALVVPGNRSLRYGPVRTVSALANASRSLEIGARNGVVHAVATPRIRTEATMLEQDGFALDDNTVLVDADAELAAWIHEYVHTRQAFSNAERLRWLTEGSARYYEWVVAAESGYSGWGSLRGVLADGANDDSILAAPDTWESETEYTKGALVLAALDREIRAATDGDRTLADALRRINGEDTAPTVDTFVRAVREVGGADAAAAAAAERYVTTPAVPDYRPTTAELATVYGRAAPEIQRRVVSRSAVVENRTRQFDGIGQVPLRPGERFRLTVRVTNTGGARGLAAVRPRLSTDRLGGDYLDTTWVGWVGPNESVTRTATHRFDRPGFHDVTWNGERYDVRVAPERGTASVTALNATGARTGDGPLAVDVTVRNDGERATFASFPVTVDGRRVSTAALIVDGGERKTVTVHVDAGVSGPTVVGMGGVNTTVDRPVQPTLTATDPGPASGSRSTVATDAEPATTAATGDAPGPGGIAFLLLVGVPTLAGLRRVASDRR